MAHGLKISSLGIILKKIKLLIVLKGPLPTTSTPVTPLPQAAAVAAAAATAKIQAIDAVATNLGINALDLLGMVFQGIFQT